MNGMGRRLYELIVKMHPAGFRLEFGGEMTLDYNDALHSYGLPGLYRDAVASVVRQWVALVIAEEREVRMVARPSLLGGQYVTVFEGGLTAIDFFRGSVLSVFFFGMFALAATPAKAALVAALHATVVRDVTIVDVEHGVLQPHKSVVIEGGRIISVTAAPGKAVVGADVVDGQGKFLIPGMWDMHSHITHPEVDMPAYLANGVLGLRSMGGVEDKVFAWKKALDDGTLFGPRAFVSGPILDGPTGPVEPASYGDRVANAEEARREVDRLKVKGADFIKVYDGLSRESYFAIAEETKKVGMRFAGHVPASITILEAVHAGQQSIEHGIEGRGESTSEEDLMDPKLKSDYMAEAMRTKNYSLIPEGIAAEGKVQLDHFSQERADALYRTLASSGTYLCPTLGVQYWIAYGDELAKRHDPREAFIDPKTLIYWQPSVNMLTRYRTPAYEEWVKVRYTKHLEQIARQQAAGVQFLTGTDLTVPYTYPGSSVHDEIKLFVKAGLTPLQALQASTTHPVEFFGLQRTLGSVTAGKMAEMVLLDGDPLRDIDSVNHISAVMTHGRLLRKPELEAMLARAVRAVPKSK